MLKTDSSSSPHSSACSSPVFPDSVQAATIYPVSHQRNLGITLGPSFFNPHPSGLQVCQFSLLQSLHRPRFYRKMARASPGRSPLSQDLFPPTRLPCLARAIWPTSAIWFHQGLETLQFSAPYSSGKPRILILIIKASYVLPLCPMSSSLSTLLPQHLSLAVPHSSQIPGHSLLSGASKPLRVLFPTLFTT